MVPAQLMLLAGYLARFFSFIIQSEQDGKKSQLSLPVYWIKLSVSKKAEVIL